MASPNATDDSPAEPPPGARARTLTVRAGFSWMTIAATLGARAIRCHLWPDEVITAERLGDNLNDSVETVVNRVRAEGFEVYYVTDTEGSVRPDDTLCNWPDGPYIDAWIPAANDA